MSRLAIIFGLIALTGSAVAAPVRVVEGFLSHRATYDLQLKSAGWAANIAGLSGRLVSEFDDVCEGYTFNQRLVTLFTDAKGKASGSNFWVSTYENADGSTYRFSLSTGIAGQKAERTQGLAKKAADGGVSVAFDEPKDGKAVLPVSVVFPTEFMGRVIAAAKAGETRLSGLMFEGDKDGKVFDTFVSIGPVQAAKADVLSIPGGMALSGLKAWPISVSYFLHGETAELPEYESSFTVFENGVTADMTLDYGSYALSGGLKKIEPLAKAACGETP